LLRLWAAAGDEIAAINKRTAALLIKFMFTVGLLAGCVTGFLNGVMRLALQLETASTIDLTFRLLVGKSDFVRKM